MPIVDNAVAFFGGICCAFVFVAACLGVERAAVRAERIYRARFRDHSAVPAIK